MKTGTAQRPQKHITNWMREAPAAVQLPSAITSKTEKSAAMRFASVSAALHQKREWGMGIFFSLT
jgi:hypothetical protein